LKTISLPFVCPSCETKNLIVQWLLIWGPAYLTQIAKGLGLDRSTLAYHLGELERKEYVESSYRLLDSNKAARFYKTKVSTEIKCLNEQVTRDAKPEEKR